MVIGIDERGRQLLYVSDRSVLMGKVIESIPWDDRAPLVKSQRKDWPQQSNPLSRPVQGQYFPTQTSLGQPRPFHHWCSSWLEAREVASNHQRYPAGEARD